MKKQINVFEYAELILKALKKGILLTTKSADQVNTMTIGWGTIGIEWNKPIFIAYVRETRHTKQLLSETGEFTVNIPFGEFHSDIARYCGTRSGRETDKIKDMHLTLVESDVLSVPGIKEFPLTLECKVLYQQAQDLNAVPGDLIARFYPAEEKTGFRDYHIAYYAEIVNAYLIED